jgi:hypothetical protein
MVQRGLWNGWVAKPTYGIASFIDVLVVSYVCKDSSLQMFCLDDYVGLGKVFFPHFLKRSHIFLLPAAKSGGIQSSCCHQYRTSVSIMN